MANIQTTTVTRRTSLVDIGNDRTFSKWFYFIFNFWREERFSLKNDLFPGFGGASRKLRRIDNPKKSRDAGAAPGREIWTGKTAADENLIAASPDLTHLRWGRMMTMRLGRGGNDEGGVGGLMKIRAAPRTFPSWDYSILVRLFCLRWAAVVPWNWPSNWSSAVRDRSD